MNPYQFKNNLLKEKKELRNSNLKFIIKKEEDDILLKIGPELY